jgi:hypothetical protein
MNIRLVILNLLVMIVVGTFGVFVKWMGWQFALGGLFGMFLYAITLRLLRGFWY